MKSFNMLKERARRGGSHDASGSSVDRLVDAVCFTPELFTQLQIQRAASYDNRIICNACRYSFSSLAS